MNIPLAESFRFLVHGLRDAIGHQRPRRRPGRRQNAHEITEERPHQHGFPGTQQAAERIHDAGHRYLRLGNDHVAPALFDGPQHLADAIDADGQHQEIDAVEKSGQVEKDQPRLAADDIEPHRRQGQAQKDGEKGFRDVVAAQPDEGSEGKNHQGEFLRRPEGERNVGQRWREQGEQHDGNRAADEGRASRRDQRPVGIALQRHGPAIEGRRDRGRGAGDAEHDRTDRAAIHRAIIKSAEKNDGACRRHEKGHRQQDSDAVDRPQTGHRPDKESGNAAKHDHQQIERLEGNQKAVIEKLENINHRSGSVSKPRGVSASIKQVENRIEQRLGEPLR